MLILYIGYNNSTDESWVLGIFSHYHPDQLALIKYVSLPPCYLRLQTLT